MPTVKQTLTPLLRDLTFPSESDRPVTYFELLTVTGEKWPPRKLTRLAEYLGRDTQTLVENYKLSDFFNRLRESNEGKGEQLNALDSAMANQLKRIRGYRVGQVTVEVYFFGVNVRGRVCGIRTMSVET
jgi:hypothetical protein